MVTKRPAATVVAALAASLLFTGCASGEAASPAGGSGGSASPQPMKQTQTPMQGEQQRMHDKGSAMRGDKGAAMQGGRHESMMSKRERMQRGHEPMNGDESQQMQRGKHKQM